MNTNQIELAIDMAAITILNEMYPNSIDVEKLKVILQGIGYLLAPNGEQPSAEELVDHLYNKYCKTEAA